MSPHSKTKRVLVFSKRNEKAARDATQVLKAWLAEKKYSVVDPSDSSGPLTEKDLGVVDLGVVIGGDGTFLTLVRRLETKDAFPLMGVNMGSLGFITEVRVGDMLQSVEAALGGKFVEEPRRLLQVEICRKDVCEVSGTVFNDAVLNKDARTSMLKFDVYVDGEFLSYTRADGFIAATPTGSTAYGLSVGGPLLHPAVNGLVLVPICSHSLSSRPVVIPDSATVELRLQAFEGAVYLVFDGQVNHEIRPQDTIRIKTAKKSLRVFRSPTWSWAETIRAKLGMS